MAPLLSVVVPTRNEAENLPVLVDRVLAALAGLEVELCIVDDSDDITPAVLEAMADARPGVVRPLLRSGEQRRGGLSTAVIEGLRMARGRYVCVMDADLQHPPETIPAMLAAAESGAGLVVASRYALGGSHGGLDGGVRRLVSRSATTLARLLFHEARRSRDPLSGFFICRRALVDGVEFRPVGFKILLELLVVLPGVTVVDVPLRFDRREHGSSKATAGQGVQYLRHLRSLVLDVNGSARLWKFGVVGLSGVAVFLPLLALAAGPAGLPALVAFVPAFLLSVAWNTLLNRVWTFADLRHRPEDGRRDYLTSALGAGVVMFGVYAALIAIGLRAVVAGLVAAVVSMGLNGFANLPAVRRGRTPSAWPAVAGDRGLDVTLEGLSRRLDADRAYTVGPDRTRLGGLVGSVLDRALSERRALLVTEAASYRPQRRTNIAVRSVIVVPMVRDDEIVGAVVVEREAPRGFEQADLETASHTVLGLDAAPLGAPAEPPLSAPAVAAPGAQP